MMKFHSNEWGEVEVILAKYPNKALAVQLWTNKSEPLARLSVNLVETVEGYTSSQLPKNCFYVKDWSENEVIAREARESGLFIPRPDLGEGVTDFVKCEAWEVKDLPA